MSDRIVKRWITFVRMPTTGKTSKWGIVNNSSGDVLGGIVWYGPWRQYCFEPVEGCVFNGGCLTDITEFMAALMAERSAVTA